MSDWSPMVVRSWSGNTGALLSGSLRCIGFSETSSEHFQCLWPHHRRDRRSRHHRCCPCRSRSPADTYRCPPASECKRPMTHSGIYVRRSWLRRRHRSEYRCKRIRRCPRPPGQGDTAIGVTDRSDHRAAYLRLPLRLRLTEPVSSASITCMVTSSLALRVSVVLAGGGHDGYGVGVLVLVVWPCGRRPAVVVQGRCR